jgi:transcriptional regulator with XRE-family HTH domain
VSIEKFGDYLQSRRVERGMTLMKFAEKVGMAVGHLSDVENGNRPVPEKALLDKIIAALSLTAEEEHRTYDIAAADKDTIAQDLPCFIKGNEVIVRALRTARDTGASVEDWEEFIRRMEAKRKGND